MDIALWEGVFEIFEVDNLIMWTIRRITAYQRAKVTKALSAEVQADNLVSLDYSLTEERGFWKDTLEIFEGSICFTDPTGLFYYDGSGQQKSRVEHTDEGIKNAESGLQSSAKDASKLGDLINTRNQAEIYMKNIGEFEQLTSDYILSLGKNSSERLDALTNILNDVTIYSDIDSNTFNSIITGNVDGVTFGRNIYLKDNISAMDAAIANLLGHECIHTMQAEMLGTTDFINQWSNKWYNDSNSFEVEAYKFGGYIAYPEFSSIDSSKQVFRQSIYRNWWIK